MLFKIKFNSTTMIILVNGNEFCIPLSRFPKLEGASKEQLERHVISEEGVHWDELDEDISIKNLIEEK